MLVHTPHPTTLPLEQAAPDALPLPAALRPFDTGVWLWCTLVLNLANLIMADRHWAAGAARGGLPPSDAWEQLPLRVRARLLGRWAAMVRTRFLGLREFGWVAGSGLRWFSLAAMGRTASGT